MAELRRRDESVLNRDDDDKELTAADLAGRTERSQDPAGRPLLGRHEPQTQTPGMPLPPPQTSTSDPRLRDENRAGVRDVQAPLTADATQFDSPPLPPANGPTLLFSESEIGDFRSRWGTIQTGFVDEPRRAVEDADNLVASLMKKLAEGFANERARLEKQWDRGDNVSTEDLRVALQRYRSFFDRLLKV